MSDITRSDVAIMEDHLMLFSEVRLSHSRARILFHQAASFTTFRTVLEQIAAGANSNADAAAWAKRVGPTNAPTDPRSSGDPSRS